MALALRYYIVSLGFLPFILNQTYDTELFYCVDWECKEYISKGKTLLSYIGKTERHLSFRKNEDIKILGKPVNDDLQDWVGLVKTKVGLVPKSMVREDQMGKFSIKYHHPLSQLPLWSMVNNSESHGTDTEQQGLAEVEKSGSETPLNEASETNSIIKDEATVEEEEKPLVGVEVEQAGDEDTVKANETANLVQESLQEMNIKKDTESVQQALQPETEAESETPSDEASETYRIKDEEVVEEEKASDAAEVEQAGDEDTVKANETANLVQESLQEMNIKKDTESIQQALQPETEAESETPSDEASETYRIKDEEVVEEEKASDAAEIEIEYEQAGNENMTETAEQANIVQESLQEMNIEKDTESVQQALEPETGAESETPSDEASETYRIKDEEVVEEEKASNAAEVEHAGDEDTVKANETANSVQESLKEMNIKKDTESVQQALQPETEAESETPSDEASETYRIKDEEVVEEEKASDAAEVEQAGDEDTVKANETANLVQESLQEMNIKKDTESIQQALQPETEAESETPSDEASETYRIKDEEVVEEEKTSDAAEIEIEHEQAGNENMMETAEQANIVQELLQETNVEEEADIKPQEQQEAVANTAPVSTPSPIDYFTDTENVSSDEQHSLHHHHHAGTEKLASEEDSHDHYHHHHGHHVHDEEEKNDTSSFIFIVKHLSYTLLSFLPEHLQETILHVDNALIFTGIIALTVICICVPYYVIEGFFAVRPLKKKVVELNKSLWKVSTAFENQQDEFEQYKKKALAYDEDKKRVEQLEYELMLVKKLEAKQKEQVAKYQKELKTHKELTIDMESFLDKESAQKKRLQEEKDKLKTTVTSLKEALRRTMEDLHDAQTQASAAGMELELSNQTNETLNSKVGMLEKAVAELKTKLIAEGERRRVLREELEAVVKSKSALENDLSDLKQICHKYEETVSALNTEISHKENELAALQETLGEDSPLIDMAEMKAQVLNAEELAKSLQQTVESLKMENSKFARRLKESTGSLSSVEQERDDALKKLTVLEAWFKEKEEDLRKAVERYEAERNIRGKDKDELVKMLEEKSDEIRDLQNKLEEFKTEYEEIQQQHRNEIRTLESKNHEQYLSLHQAERKAQEARKEAQLLRQKLTEITKEKDGESVNGEATATTYPLITPDMVPLPLPDDVHIPSYFGLGDGFIPPPPLPLDDEQPHRPAPLGRMSPMYSDLDDTISPVGRDRDRHRTFSDGSSSASDSPRRRSPRGRVDQRDRRDREERFRRRSPGPLTSSPIQGFNL